MTEYTLDKDTSAFHNWLAEGAPQYPSKAETEKLKSISVPKMRKSTITGFGIDTVLAPHEVRMYIIKKSE